MRQLFVVLAVVSGTACAFRAPPRLEGRVLDQVTGRPIRYAGMVAVRPLADTTAAAWREARIDRCGRYRFGPLAAGPYALRVGAVQFRPTRWALHLEASATPGTDTLDLALERVPAGAISHGGYDDSVLAVAANCGVAQPVRQTRSLQPLPN